MLPHSFSKSGLSALAAAALLTLSPKLGHAEQFVLFDVTFTMTWEDATTSSPSKSHHYVKSNSGLNAQRPMNWLTPVNYRDGTVHIYLEVLEKPEGGQMQGWAMCYVGGGGYGCPYTPYYTEKGVYERDVDMHGFYNNAQIDYTKISEVDLIYTINDSGSGHVHYFPDLKDKTTPTKVRMAMVQVSQGSTYDPTILTGTGGSMGGGGGMGGAAGAAGTLSGGAGGASGSGGASGGGSESPTQGGLAGSATEPMTSGTSGGGAASAGAPARAGAGSIVPGATPTTTTEEGGCNVVAAPHASRLPWLVLAALTLLRRRRAPLRPRV
jgi:MYXO-CTERM domain-containing protein